MTSTKASSFSSVEFENSIVPFATPVTRREFLIWQRKSYTPKKLVIAERYRFHNCVQKEGESVSEFVANLKRLASTCNFGAYLNEALRDRFVCGLRSANIKKKLLADDYTFDNALKVALGIEAADKDVADISQAGTHPVNKVGGNSSHQRNPRQQKGKSGESSKPDKGSPCASCGKKGHARSNCKYRNFSCYTCDKAGHIAKACRSKKTQLNNVQSTSYNENLADPFSTAMYKVGGANKHGIEIPIEINGAKLLMELDTGAGISIISKETFDTNFNGISLKPCSALLHTYTGDPIKVCGQFDASVNYNSQRMSLPLIVVEGSGPSLFGRDWLTKIRVDWKRIFNVSVPTTPELSTAVTQRLHATIQTYSGVFKQGLGTIKGIKAKLDVTDDAHPKFCKARPVPYALKYAVDDEYDRLEREGIIEKVEFSEWATPMVHIPKSDNTTRSCGDYAVTVNPQLQVPHYPIPLPEDVFQKLRGGKLFSKLDLKNAYQQLLLDDESQQYVTINTHRGLYRYKRLPFGIAASPAIFQRSIDVILQGIDNVAAIQDDILVTGKDDADHLRNLEATLSRLQEYGVRLKLEKCKFMQKSVTYMGCIISASGIHPTEEKVEAVKNAPRPRILRS